MLSLILSIFLVPDCSFITHKLQWMAKRGSVQVSISLEHSPSIMGRKSPTTLPRSDVRIRVRLLPICKLISHTFKIGRVVANSSRKCGFSRSYGTSKATVPLEYIAATGIIVSVRVARVILMQAFVVKLGTAAKQDLQNYISECQQIPNEDGRHDNACISFGVEHKHEVFFTKLRMDGGQNKVRL